MTPLPGQRILMLAALLAAACVLPACSLRMPVSTTFPQTQPERTAQRFRPAGTETPPPPAPDPLILVWVTADRYHTGMVFPYEWLLESGFVPPPGFASAHHVSMSWGNHDAYSEAGLDNAWKWFRVLLTPTPSVMEAIPTMGNVVDTLPKQRIWRGLVPRSRGPELAAFLNGCTQQDLQGRPIVVAPSSWGQGVQLQGRYRYFIPRVCNVWTLQAVESLGFRINPWRALTADGLAREIQKAPMNFELVWSGSSSGEDGETTTPVDVAQSTDSGR